MSSDAARTCPAFRGLQAKPYLLNLSDLHSPNRVPAAPFLILTHKAYIRIAQSTPVRFAGVLCPIEYEHLSGDSFGSNEVGILRHIPRAVDFAGMVDLLSDLDSWLRGDGMSAKLATLIIVVTAIKYIRGGTVVTFGQMYSRNL